MAEVSNAALPRCERGSAPLVVATVRAPSAPMAIRHPSGRPSRAYYKRDVAAKRAVRGACGYRPATRFAAKSSTANPIAAKLMKPPNMKDRGA